MAETEVARNGRPEVVVRCEFALRHPPEVVEANYGRYVAWSYDGTQALAAGATLCEVYSEVDRLQLTEYIVGYVYAPDDAFL